MTPTPKPFSFTRWFHAPDAVRFWFAHFVNKKIPVGIVSRAQSPRYSVWRYGVEAKAEKTNMDDVVTADMAVDRSAFGFEEKFNNYKKEVLDGGRQPAQRQA